MAENLKLGLSVDKAGLASMDQLQSKMRRFGNESDKTSSKIGGLGRGLKAAIAVTGINQAIGLLRQLGAVASQVGQQIEEGIEANRAFAAFDRLAAYAGKTSEEINLDLRKATMFEIDDTTLLQWSNRLTKITNDASKSASLIGLAYGQAIAEGMAPKKYMRTLFSSIASGSAESASQLGLFVDGEKAVADAAEAAGKKVEWLTASEKLRAKQSAVITAAERKFAESVRGTGEAYLELKTNIANLKSEFQQGLAGGQPGGMSDIWGEMFRQDSLDMAVSEYGRALQKMAADEDIYYQLRAEAENKGGFVDIKKIQELSGYNLGMADEAATAWSKLSSTITTATQDAVGFVKELDKVNLAKLVASPATLERGLSALKSSAEDISATIAALQQGGVTKQEATEIDKLTTALTAVTTKTDQWKTVQDAVNDASIASIDATTELIAKMREMGIADEEGIAVLERRRAAMKQVKAESLKILDGLSKVNGMESLSLAGELGLDDPATLTQAADQFERIAQTRTALQEALKAGDVQTASEEFATLQQQTMEAANELRALGVDSGALNGVVSRLTSTFSTYDTQLQLIERRSEDVGTATRETIKLLDEMIADSAGTAPGFLGTTPTPKPKRGGGGQKDITKEELRLRLEATKEGLSDIERAEAEHAMRLYRIDQDNRGRKRALLAAQAEDQLQHNQRMDQLRKAEADRIAQEDARIAEAARRRQEAIDRGIQSGLEWTDQYIAGLGRINDALLEQAIATGEITRLEAERARISAELQNQNLSETDRTILNIRMETTERQMAIQMLQAQADAVRGVGAAMVEATANASQLASLSGETLDPRIQAVTGSIGKFGDSLGDLIKNSSGTMKQMGPAIAGMTTAIGSAVAGMGMGAQESAALMAAVATANAIFLAFINPAAAAQQAAAAIAYGVVAGMSGGGSKASAAASRSTIARSASTETRSASGGGDVYLTLAFGGERLHTDEQIADRVMDVLPAGQYSGKKIPARMVG